jgi:uncharacterized OB-fold protein
MSNPSEVWRHHKRLQQYLNKKGRLLVWTKVSVPPLGFEDSVPYFSGIVQFEDGVKLPVQIVDCAEIDLKENLKVMAVIRRGKKVKADEVIEYVVKVKPFDTERSRSTQSKPASKK